MSKVSILLALAVPFGNTSVFSVESAPDRAVKPVDGLVIWLFRESILEDVAPDGVTPLPHTSLLSSVTAEELASWTAPFESNTAPCSEVTSD